MSFARQQAPTLHPAPQFLHLSPVVHAMELAARRGESQRVACTDVGCY